MRTDVAVVGAGPAGGQAARYLAHAGLDVTLLEVRRSVGEPVQCAEAISQVALGENALRPGDWVVSKVRGVSARAPDTGAARLTAPGYCVDRASFDQSLVEQAEAKGAHLWTSCRVSEVRAHGDGYHVETTRGPVQARFVIAADGPQSSTARRLGLVDGWRCNVGLQYKFPAETVGAEADWLHLFLAEHYKGGYAWIFPRGREVSVGVDVDEHPQAQLESFCRTWGLNPDQRLATNGGRIPTRVEMKSLGVGNVLVVGDAAGATNPIFGGGIHAALTTGRLAGQAILEVEGNGFEKAAAIYERRARESPFFHPVLPQIAKLLKASTDEELRLAVRVYRARHHVGRLLRLLPDLLRRPRMVRKASRLPALRVALEITARHGW